MCSKWCQTVPVLPPTQSWASTELVVQAEHPPAHPAPKAGAAPAKVSYQAITHAQEQKDCFTGAKSVRPPRPRRAPVEEGVHHMGGHLRLRRLLRLA